MKPSELFLLCTLITGLLSLFAYLRDRAQRKQLKRAVQSGIMRIVDPILEFSRSFFPIFLVVLLLRSFLVEPFRIPSGSMLPTLMEGDFILVNKFVYGLKLPISGTPLFKPDQPKRGDVVVFSQGRKDVIKRVVGLPGDKIRYDGQFLYVNGQPMMQTQYTRDSHARLQSWPFQAYTEQLGSKKHAILRKVDKSDWEGQAVYPYGSVLVPKDSYYVLGDNRDNSADSRYWGFVKNKEIQGKAFFIFTSIDWDKYRLRWDRLLSSIE